MLSLAGAVLCSARTANWTCITNSQLLLYCMRANERFILCSVGTFHLPMSLRRIEMNISGCCMQSRASRIANLNSQVCFVVLCAAPGNDDGRLCICICFYDAFVANVHIFPGHLADSGDGIQWFMRTDAPRECVRTLDKAPNNNNMEILFSLSLSLFYVLIRFHAGKAVAELKSNKYIKILLSHIVKMLNVFHHVYTNQKPLFLPKGQKSDLFIGSKELQMLNSMGYFGNDYFYLNLYRSLRVSFESFKVSAGLASSISPIHFDVGTHWDVTYWLSSRQISSHPSVCQPPGHPAKPTPIYL